MIGQDRYLNAYVDRRMKYIIEEWDLATRNELDDFTRRMGAIEAESPRIKAFEGKASDKLTELESRVKKLKEMM
ncbi:MAG: hypothetical protein LUP97_03895 [Methanoregula sp.]|jgi:polyhydroxyalkanoate synthesis regulator phasin|nr:hypothetical protein [Methanoregula sp.]